jgi:hypothetical protein
MEISLLSNFWTLSWWKADLCETGTCCGKCCPWRIGPSQGACWTSYRACLGLQNFMSAPIWPISFLYFTVNAQASSYSLSSSICESQLFCFFTAIESPIALEFPIPDSQFNRFWNLQVSVDIWISFALFIFVVEFPLARGDQLILSVVVFYFPVSSALVTRQLYCQLHSVENYRARSTSRIIRQIGSSFPNMSSSSSVAKCSPRWAW